MQRHLSLIILCVSIAASESVVHAAPKIAVLGDSYSTFQGHIPAGNAIWYFAPPKNQNDVVDVEQTWWRIAARRLSCDIALNESFSGPTICNTGYGGKDSTRSSFLTRAARLPADAQVILVFGATNDSWANAPIGDYQYGNWSDDDLRSFRPALAKLFADLAASHPEAHVFFLLNSELKPAINDSAHEICAHYQVPCIDLHDIAKQHGHPSIEGMKAIADQVVEAVAPIVKKLVGEEPAEEPATLPDAA